MKRTLCPLLTAVTLLAVSPALAASGGSFKGSTSDGRSVALRAGGARVSAFSFSSRFHCGNGSSFVARASYHSLKLKRGRFRSTFATPNRALTTAIVGTIRGRRASGTISRRATFNSARKLDPKGSLVCTSRTSWKATKR